MEENYNELLKKFEDVKNESEKNNVYNIDKLSILVKKILKYNYENFEKRKIELNISNN